MKTVIAGALGECVHVAGVTNFLRLAEQAGWRTVFLGPAVSIDEFIEIAIREKADLVGVSYRLTPENGARLLGEFAEAADDLESRASHASAVESDKDLQTLGLTIDRKPIDFPVLLDTDERAVRYSLNADRAANLELLAMLDKIISEKGLRYDLTIPFARYVVQHQNDIAFP